MPGPLQFVDAGGIGTKATRVNFTLYPLCTEPWKASGCDSERLHPTFVLLPSPFCHVHRSLEERIDLRFAEMKRQTHIHFVCQSCVPFLSRPWQAPGCDNKRLHPTRVSQSTYPFCPDLGRPLGVIISDYTRHLYCDHTVSVLISVITPFL